MNGASLANTFFYIYRGLQYTVYLKFGIGIFILLYIFNIYIYCKYLDVLTSTHSGLSANLTQFLLLSRILSASLFFFFLFTPVGQSRCWSSSVGVYSRFLPSVERNTVFSGHCHLMLLGRDQLVLFLIVQCFEMPLNVID